MAEERNVINIGSSLGFIIPDDMVKKLGVSEGSKLDVVFSSNGLKLSKEQKGLSSEFVRALNDALMTLQKNND